MELKIKIRLTDNEKSFLNVNVDTIKYKVSRKDGVIISVLDLEENQINISITDLVKVVYSTIEVNFEQKEVIGVTAKNIDEEETPKERSYNLSSEIPQLLVDIKSLDDSDRGNFLEQNVGQEILIPNNIGNRLKRFTNAFHKIYDGTKKFLEIRNVNGRKEIVFSDENDNELFLKDLSTGEKQIIYRVGYILKNIGNIDGAIILIDEPEISLHPAWQLKFKDFLHEIFNGYDIQLIIATHSPYIFDNLDENKESCIKIDRSKPFSSKISLVLNGVPNFKPSVGLISYLAYGIYNESLHIELYSLLQIKLNRNINNINNWLLDPNGGSMAVRQTFLRGGIPQNETLITWIRNKIHHRDEVARPEYTKDDLKESIDTLIRLLQ